MKMEKLRILSLYIKVFVLMRAQTTCSLPYLPSILWDPRNYIFSCDLTINVRLNDILRITCPNQGLNARSLDRTLQNTELNENIYLLDEKQSSDFSRCDATSGKLLDECKAGSTLQYVELMIRTTASSATTPVFKAGSKYYLIGTGNGSASGLKNRIGGHCNASKPGFFPLRMTIYVCTDQESTYYKNCTCETSSCFENKCGVLGDWNQTDTYLWNGTACLQRETRTCGSKYFKCGEGPYERYILARNDLCKLYEVCPSPSVYPETLFTSATDLASSETPSCSCPNPTSATHALIASYTPAGSDTSFTTSSISDTSLASAFTTTVDITVTEVSVNTVMSVSMSAVTSVSVSTVTSCAESILTTTTTTATSTITVEKTTTKTETTTVTPSCDPKTICTVVTPITCLPIVQLRDTGDTKFYITVASGILGAVLVGVFVTHACSTYYRVNRKSLNVIQVAPYETRRAESASMSGGVVG